MTQHEHEYTYEHGYEFFRDVGRLLDEGATLRDLFDALRAVAHPSWATEDDPTAVDLSAERRRVLIEVQHDVPEFLPIRLHELFGGLEIPHDDDYVLVMIGALGIRGTGARTAEESLRTVLLRHDHALREEDFWRFFEVEGGGQVSLANIDKYSAEHHSWQRTVLALAGEGVLDRQRLLRSSLEALTRDFSSYRAGWFSRLFIALKPTAEDAAAEQDLLRRCLASGVTATVSLAAKQLEAIHRAGKLETGEFVLAVGPAMTGSKATAQSMIRVLESLLDREQVDADAAVGPFAEALTHPHLEIQRSAATRLLTMDREDLVREHRDVLAPAVAAEVLPEQEGRPADRTDGPGAHEPVTHEPVAHEHGELSSSLPPARELTPWSDADAAERFSLLLEQPSDALELELAMAWLATSEQAPTVLAPLASRVRTVDPEHDRFWIVELLRAVLGLDEEFFPRTHRHPDVSETGGEEVPCDSPLVELLPPAEAGTVLPSLLTRLREVVAIVLGRAPRRMLLATPTDSHGWIDADSLRARADAIGTAPPVSSSSDVPDPREADLQQAILRVRPAERDRVQTLFGAPPPRVTGHVRIEWIRHVSESTVAGRTRTSSYWTPALLSDVPEPSCVHPALLATTAEERPQSRRTLNAVVIGELGLVNPASTLPLLAGIRSLHEAGDGEVEDTRHALLLLEALSDHPGEWTAETAQLLALGLAGKDAAVRTLAAELFAAAVPTRLTVDAAAAGFAGCAPAVVLTRWVSGLGDAATLAPGPVMDLLVSLLPRLDRSTHGLGKLLDLLRDESIRQTRTLDNSRLLDWLGGFSGSSAAARTARSLRESASPSGDAVPRSR